MIVRRVLSVVLFVLGAWLLSSAVVLAWMDLGARFGTRLAALGFMTAFSAPFLLLAIWTSPGSRLRELGLTLLISAGVGASLALVMILLANDSKLHELMPADQSLAQLEFTPLFGACVVLTVSGLGWLLYRRRKNGK